MINRKMISNKNSEISDSDSSTNDGTLHADKKSRLENNFDDRDSDDDRDNNDGGKETNDKSRNSIDQRIGPLSQTQTENPYQRFGPLSQTQTEIGDNTKIKTKKSSREAERLKSYNRTPPEIF